MKDAACPTCPQKKNKQGPQDSYRESPGQTKGIEKDCQGGFSQKGSESALPSKQKPRGDQFKRSSGGEAGKVEGQESQKKESCTGVKRLSNRRRAFDDVMPSTPNRGATYPPSKRAGTGGTWENLVGLDCTHRTTRRGNADRNLSR